MSGLVAAATCGCPVSWRLYILTRYKFKFMAAFDLTLFVWLQRYRLGCCTKTVTNLNFYLYFCCISNFCPNHRFTLASLGVYVYTSLRSDECCYINEYVMLCYLDAARLIISITGFCCWTVDHFSVGLRWPQCFHNAEVWANNEVHIFVPIDLDLWPFDLKFAPQVTHALGVIGVMSPLHLKFLWLSNFEQCMRQMETNGQTEGHDATLYAAPYRKNRIMILQDDECRIIVILKTAQRNIRSSYSEQSGHFWVIGRLRRVCEILSRLFIDRRTNGLSAHYPVFAETCIISTRRRKRNVVDHHSIALRQLPVGAVQSHQ